MTSLDSDDGAVVEQTGSAPTPEELLLAAQLDEALDGVVALMPPDMRAVFTSRSVRGMSYAQMAQTMGVPLGTVRSRLHRGRRMLQKRLWRYAVDDGIISRMAEEQRA